MVREEVSGARRERPQLVRLLASLPPGDVALATRLDRYCDGLGFGALARFEDRQGFDGVVLGHPGAPCHLGFTRERGHVAGRAPSKEHLLAFCLPDRAARDAAVARMRASGLAPGSSHDPCWDAQGFTFEDPDGYRVVLQNAAWPA